MTRSALLLALTLLAGCAKPVPEPVHIVTPADKMPGTKLWAFYRAGEEVAWCSLGDGGCWKRFGCLGEPPCSMSMEEASALAGVPR